VTAGVAADGRRSFTVVGRQSAWVIDDGGRRTEYSAGSTLTVP